MDRSSMTGLVDHAFREMFPQSFDAPDAEQGFNNYGEPTQQSYVYPGNGFQGMMDGQNEEGQYFQFDNPEPFSPRDQAFVPQGEASLAPASYQQTAPAQGFQQPAHAYQQSAHAYQQAGQGYPQFPHHRLTRSMGDLPNHAFSSTMPAQPDGTPLYPGSKVPISRFNSAPEIQPATGPMSKDVKLLARPKPGRKPMATTDDPLQKRREQNRLAQRSFRDKRTQKQADLNEQLQMNRLEYQQKVGELQGVIVGLQSQNTAKDQRIAELEGQVQMLQGQQGRSVYDQQ